jgi:NADPH:quinone reductase-like Zn-dependent oxidoreductase
MKSFAFFNKDSFPAHLIKTSNSFVLDGVTINVGIIEEEDTVLSACEDHSRSVLVKKIAFSCNYRDKPMIFYVNDKINTKNADNLFSHIGSEFVGEIIKVGEDVKNLKVGDKVIPNVSYSSTANKSTIGIPSNGVSKRLEIFNESDLIKVYSDIPDVALAAFPISSFTAYSMIRKVVKPKSKVLVTAAKSNTSLAVISALRNKDVELYAMTSSGNFNKELYALGVKKIFQVNHDIRFLNSNTYDAISQVGKFDAVIDPFFDIYFQKVAGLIAMDGKYITCGLHNQFVEQKLKEYDFNIRDVFINLMINNISIIGNCLGLEKDGFDALEECRTGEYQILIDSVYGFNEEHSFLKRTYDFKNKIGKVIYRYDD